MACPTCGMRQWRYDETTLTCKNGHHFPIDPEPKRRPLPPAFLVAGAATATLALDFLVRAIT